MKTNFLDELNPIQKEAASHTEGPVMILAGAGSGKTRVLTYRIAHLMQKGVDPFHILSLTFTNKAAREMKDRIGKLVGQKDAKALWMGTFHSIFAKILRFEAEKIGFPSNFTIYDTDDCKSVIKDILKFLNVDDKVYKPSLVLNRISSAKNNLITPRQYMNNSVIQSEDRSSQKPQMGAIYEMYAKRLFKAGAMDFDDLLFHTNVLLRDFPDVLFKYQDKFRYILVDEYQDTNFSQYVIVKQLAARFQNICVVGDDAQSIYAFRGANIQNILNFAKDYPDYKEFKLEQNYRSTQVIVHAANSIIANNKDQFKKNVWTANEEGQKIKIFSAVSDNEEGFKIANSIMERQKEAALANREFAILYRTNAQSRPLEEALRRLHIPYKIYGGISFYQRKEIKDTLAYYRLSINPNEDEALKRIINYPARGIGQTTIDKIQVAATEHGISLWTVLENLHDFKLGINGPTTQRIQDFVSMIKNFGYLIPFEHAYDAANKIAIESGILRDLYADKTPEGVSRYENVQSLLNGIRDFMETERSPQEEELKEHIFSQDEKQATELFLEKDKQKRTLDEFMQEITLLTDADNESEEERNADKVALMTVHAAKGLEFPYVYLAGLEENLFPSQMSVNSRSDLEEERRLFYVAITRAEKAAFISYATSRFRFGNVVFCEPSRFIEELKPELIEHEFNPQQERSFSKGLFDSFKKNPENAKISFQKKEIGLKKSTGESGKIILPKPKLSPVSNPGIGVGGAMGNDLQFIKNLKEGDMVSHERFGIGKIILLEGDFPNTKALVQFPTGEKNLILKYAKLRPHTV